MTFSNDLSLMIDQVTYEINYVDYDEDSFTYPAILTKDRAENLLTDLSIRKVRFTPILNSVFSVTLYQNELSGSHD